MSDGATLTSRCCPDPATGMGGSKDIGFGPNRVGELMTLIGQQLTPA